MHIGGIMVFDPLPGGGTPSHEELCQQLASRLGQLPRYGQRLSQPHTGGLSWPTWEDDPAFDIGTHVARAALPAPGGDEELAQWASNFFSQRLDRHRPLWEMAIVEGLADGRWALATKTHHCMVDGVGSVDVTHLLLDTTPDAAPAASSSPSSASAATAHHPPPGCSAPHVRRPPDRLGLAGVSGARVGGSAAGRNNPPRGPDGRPRRAAPARSAAQRARDTRTDRTRGAAARGAAHESQRADDRHATPVRGHARRAGGPEGDQGLSRRHGQRRRAHRHRERAAGAASVPRRGAAGGRAARDGPDERPRRE